MWLKNYYNWIYAQLCIALGPSNAAQPLSAPYKSVTGTLVSSVNGARSATVNYGAGASAIAAAFTAVVPALSYTGVSTQSGHTTALALVLGRGTTKETAEDFALEDLITSGFTLSRTFDRTDDTLTQHNYFLNSGADAVTVGEIGLSYGNYLMYRKALDEPITVGVGETLHIAYTINTADGSVTVGA